MAAMALNSLLNCHDQQAWICMLTFPLRLWFMSLLCQCTLTCELFFAGFWHDYKIISIQLGSLLQFSIHIVCTFLQYTDLIRHIGWWERRFYPVTFITGCLTGNWSLKINDVTIVVEVILFQSHCCENGFAWFWKKL